MDKSNERLQKIQKSQDFPKIFRTANWRSGSYQSLQADEKTALPDRYGGTDL